MSQLPLTGEETSGADSLIPERIGPKARVMRDHGEFLGSKLGRAAVPTLHPSAVLRAEDKDREDAMAMLVGDLQGIASRLDGR